MQLHGSMYVHRSMYSEGFPRLTVFVVFKKRASWASLVGLCGRKHKKNTTWYIHIWNQLSSRILNIPISKHKNVFYKKRQIFRRHFHYLNLLLCWREIVKSYLYKPRNLFPKKNVNWTKTREVIAINYKVSLYFWHLL